MSEGNTKSVEVMLGEPHKAILSLAVPVFVSLVVSQVNIFVDNMWCSSLGIDALSAINLVSSLFFIIISIGNGIGVGINVAISRRIGAGDREGAEKCVAQTMTVMFFASLILIPVLYLTMEPFILIMGGEEIMEKAKAYLTPVIFMCFLPILSGILSNALRGEGAAKLSTTINIAGALFNMVVDPLLIFTLGLGLAGAALATMLSSAVTLAAGLYLYRSGRTYLGFRLSRPERSIIGDVMYVGVPQLVEQEVQSILNIFLVYFVLVCGGTDGLAIYSMPWRFVSLSTIPANALSVAMISVCASAIGQRDRERMSQGYYFTVKTGIILGVVMAALLCVFADYAMVAFTYADEMVQYRSDMVHAMRIFTGFMPFYAIIAVGAAALSAFRKSTYVLASSFVRNVVLIAIFYIASSHTMDWIYWGLVAGEVFGGFLMISLAQWQYRLNYRQLGTEAPV